MALLLPSSVSPSQTIGLWLWASLVAPVEATVLSKPFYMILSFYGWISNIFQIPKVFFFRSYGCSVACKRVASDHSESPVTFRVELRLCPLCHDEFGLSISFRIRWVSLTAEAEGRQVPLGTLLSHPVTSTLVSTDHKAHGAQVQTAAKQRRKEETNWTPGTGTESWMNNLHEFLYGIYLTYKNSFAFPLSCACQKDWFYSCVVW